MHRAIVTGLVLCLVSRASAQSASQLEFFEKKIRPILAGNCAACHNATALTANLDLSTTEGIRYAVQYGDWQRVCLRGVDVTPSLLALFLFQLMFMDTAATIPGAELAVVPGMGHDLPPALYDTIIDVIVRVAQRAKAAA